MFSIHYPGAEYRPIAAALLLLPKWKVTVNWQSGSLDLHIRDRVSMSHRQLQQHVSTEYNDQAIKNES